ncbi:YdcH family protein [Rhizobium sp. S153]|uniref:YdcH family protein n=1 Tax=Ciceribacter sichuanensis TaxID=2949647 RepID=A0ABT0V160_9HYPH|nr:YdcH family protein [Ciceribacter sp. S153]MCM2399629.1 YdcH family protein [Ciceribacter sp. S153]
MSNTPHEIQDEFPEYADKMHALKAGDESFGKLLEDYREVNRAIHRAETEVEPVGDVQMETMRKQRMVLKDEIYGMLTKA